MSRIVNRPNNRSNSRALAAGAVLCAGGLLAGCHAPQPFRGKPGRMGELLSAPPPARIAVAVAPGALLDDAARSVWTKDTVDALLAQTIPAENHPPRPGDWRLQLEARLAGGQVVPGYVVLTPTGQVKGRRDGAPVPASAWSSGDPAMLQRVSEALAPQVVTTLTGLRAAEMRADPNSLMNRPARIYFTGVKGAPGDGNAVLASLMHDMLPDPKDVLVASAEKADYTVSGVVSVGAPKPTPQGAMQNTEISWHVHPAHGPEAGAATQLNVVPVGSLDHAWGPVALAVVTEAAPAVREVIDNNSSRLTSPPPAGMTPPGGATGSAPDVLGGPPGVGDTPSLAPDEVAPGVRKLNVDLADPTPFRAPAQKKSGS